MNKCKIVLLFYVILKLAMVHTLKSYAFKIIERLEKHEILNLTDNCPNGEGISKVVMDVYKYTTIALIFAKNGLCQIPEFVKKLENLEIMILHENDATSILNGFPYLPSLKTLFISNYKNLEYIGPQAFQSFPNLETLVIINNKKLVAIDPDALTFYHQNSTEKYYLPIVNLDISNNSLEIFHPNLLENWKSIKQIDIRGNLWDCMSCKNRFSNQLINHMKIIESPSLDQTYCFIKKNAPEKVLINIFFKNTAHRKECKNSSNSNKNKTNTFISSSSTGSFSKFNVILSSTLPSTTLIMDISTKVPDLSNISKLKNVTPRTRQIEHNSNEFLRWMWIVPPVILILLLIVINGFLYYLRKIKESGNITRNDPESCQNFLHNRPSPSTEVLMKD